MAEECLPQIFMLIFNTRWDNVNGLGLRELPPSPLPPVNMIRALTKEPAYYFYHTRTHLDEECKSSLDIEFFNTSILDFPNSGTINNNILLFKLSVIIGTEVRSLVSALPLS